MEERYAKNLGTFGEDGQRRIRASSVAIVGAGGLGGFVFEILLRAGVGRIKIIDGDTFEASNLNRQLLSTTENMGRPKATEAAARARQINPDTIVVPIVERLTEANAEELIGGVDLVCDCIDSIKTRFIIERAAGRLCIPLVHAAVAGLVGHVMTISPGGKGLESIYGPEEKAPEKGDESDLGNPPSSVCAVAALAAHEAINILTGKGNSLKDTLVRIDLRNFEIKKYSFR
jgi:molybdopterin/thiamine biosynthesis adenylyltransferase